MSTLKQKAQDILDEKEEKIIPENIKKDIQVFDVTGILEEGTDTSDATATASDLVMNATAYVKGVKISGSIRDYRSESGISDFDDAEYAGEIPAAAKLKILTHMASSAADTVISSDNNIEFLMPYSELTTNLELTADKLKRGVTILGITGTLDSTGTDTSDATATADDIVENTTAYVDGVKLTGNIIDRRSPSLAVGLEPTSIGDNSNTELIVELEYVPDNSLKPNVVVNDTTPLYTAVQYSDIVNELNITSDMIRVGKEILGVTGTYSGYSIVYLEPGDEIHINMAALQTALLNATDAETRAQELAYDSEGEDLFTAKLMDCVNLGQPYNNSGIGLVMDGTTTYLKIYNWDPTTDTNTLQSSDYIELVSGDYPEQINFDISSFISILQHLGGYGPTDLTFTYPSNAPIIPLINDNTIKLLTQDGCDIGEVLTFNIPSTYIRIVKAC